jgi:hypothetical protein
LFLSRPFDHQRWVLLQQKTMDPGLQTVVVSAVFLALAIIVVLLRLVTRLYIVKTPGLDDGFMLFALCLDVGLFATIEIRMTAQPSTHLMSLIGF